jgi:uncharacterized protein involved in exopolysaccharide biosynthesis/Mrp family chromosome partitioning ATPase
MSAVRDLGQDVDIDIAGLLAEVWKRKFFIAIVTIASCVALFMAMSSISPRYKASARVLIENRESVYTRRAEGDLGIGASQFDEQAIGSQVQILSSDDIALKVISQLDLASDPEFGSGAQPSLLDSLLAGFGADGGAASLTPEERVLKTFRKRLQVFAADKSRVIVIEFWAKSRDMAQRVPNAIADEYLELNKQAKLESNAEATEWLGPEIDALRNKVRSAEAKVAEFRASSDILLGNNNALLATQQLSEASSELSRLRADRSAAEAKAQAIRAAIDQAGSLDIFPEVSSAPLIQRLRERQVGLRAEISELSTSLLPGHPRLKALNSQVADFDNQIRVAARDIVTGLQNNVAVLRNQEQVLIAEVDRLKAESARVGEAEVELRALEREANSQRQLLENYLTQFRAAASRQDREYLPVDARIISRAVRPVDHYFPKVIPFTIAGTLTVLILLVAGVLAIALMTGRAFRAVPAPGMAAGPVAASAVPQRIEPEPYRPQPAEELVPPAPSPEAIDRALGRRNPAAQEKPANVAPQPQQRPVSQQYVDRILASQSFLPEIEAPAMAPDLPGEPAPSGRPHTVPVAANDPETFAFRHTEEAIRDMGRARIAIVSPAGDPGSELAWLLSRRLAETGSSVALVDLTGSGVTAQQFLGRGDLPGLRDLLSGAAGFSQCIHRDRHSGVYVMPAGLASDAPISMDRLAMVADAMDENYDFVLFDCGFTGPAGLSRLVDPETVVLISREGATVAEAAQCMDEFRASGMAEAVLVRIEPEFARMLAGAA